MRSKQEKESPTEAAIGDGRDSQSAHNTGDHHWMTQHWHLDFFLITTCSTWLSPATGATTPRWTSIAPLSAASAAFFSCSVKLPLILPPSGDSALLVGGDEGVETFRGGDPLSWTACSGLCCCCCCCSSSTKVGCDCKGTPSLFFNTSEMDTRPPLSNSTSSSASRLRSPSGRNGLSWPDSVLQK